MQRKTQYKYIERPTKVLIPKTKNLKKIEGKKLKEQKIKCSFGCAPELDSY